MRTVLQSHVLKLIDIGLLDFKRNIFYTYFELEFFDILSIKFLNRTVMSKAILNF